MLIKDQIVRGKWNNNNKEWYESHGYPYTKRYDDFFVPICDLFPGSTARVDVVCDYCGRTFDTVYYILNRGRSICPKDSCRYCASIKANEISYSKRAHKKFSQLKHVCDKLGYTVLTKESEYTGTDMKIRFICPKHGEVSMSLDNLVAGHQCIACSYEKRGEEKKLSIEFVDETISAFGSSEWLNKDEYIDSTTQNLLFRCSCGNTFTTSYSCYTRNMVRRCPVCSQIESNGELIIREWLEDHGIRFIFGKRFADCRDKKPLPFDFYLPDHNVCIEFDGQHHYMELEGWADHETTVLHDQIKNKYCDDNNIKLIRIPYWDGKRISKILSTELL